MLMRRIWITRRKLEYSILSQSCNHALRRLSSQPEGKPSEEKTNDELSGGSMKNNVHFTTNLDKYLLVWTKRFPSVAEVPAEVPQHMMQRTRTEARIRINIIMCILTILTCLAMAISGRRAAERGESIEKLNLDWHKQINKEDASK